MEALRVVRALEPGEMGGASDPRGPARARQDRRLLDGFDAQLVVERGALTLGVVERSTFGVEQLFALLMSSKCCDRSSSRYSVRYKCQCVLRLARALPQSRKAEPCLPIRRRGTSTSRLAS